jgi:hypothetical protein
MNRSLPPLRPAPAALPAYPTRAQVDADRGLLIRYAPAAWRRSGLLMALLVGTLPTAQGCGQPAKGVAPIFEHGNGLAWWGCLVMVPPVYLSESEARNVVTDALMSSGLGEPKTNEEMPDSSKIDIEVDSCGRVEESGTSSGLFTADLYWDEQDMGVEIVTMHDWNTMHRTSSDTEYGCEGDSVGYGDVIGAARAQADLLANHGGPHWYGVLYDPIVQGCPKEHHYEKSDCTEQDRVRPANDFLRAQVQDLVAWMKQNGLL